MNHHTDPKCSRNLDTSHSLLLSDSQEDSIDEKQTYCTLQITDNKSNSFEQKYNEQNEYNARSQPFSQYMSSEIASLNIGQSKVIHLPPWKYKLTKVSENVVNQTNLCSGKRRRIKLKITSKSTRTHLLRKCCVLSICIEEYHDHNKIGESGDIIGRNRLGCGADIQHILNTFDINGWRYDIIRNTLEFEKKVTIREYNRLIKEAQDTLNDTYDAFFFIFSGHGTNSSICLSPDTAPLDTENSANCPEIDISSILNQFKNSIPGKPKIFIISACTDSIRTENIEKDMMLLNVVGEARRDTENGSYLIQVMNQVFKDKNASEIPLHCLMECIKSNVCKMSKTKMRCKFQNNCSSVIYFPPVGYNFKGNTVSDPYISENQTVSMYWTYAFYKNNNRLDIQKNLKDVKLIFGKKVNFYVLKDKEWKIIYGLSKTDIISVGKIYYQEKEWLNGKKVRGFDIKSISNARISIYDMNSTLARERHKQFTKFANRK